MASFTYSANVKCVNGTDTWVEFLFRNYTGTLSTDITAISVTGPSGVIADQKTDFTFYDDMNYVMYFTGDNAPEIGSYTFSVTIGGETVQANDSQIVNRTLPVVDPATMVPAPGSTVPTDTTFTWSAVADQGYDIYYGIQIRDNNGNYVANVRYVGNFDYDINLPAGDYTWQIICMDGVDWVDTNNRTHNNWQSFTIA